MKEKLNRILNECKAGVSIHHNEHKNLYETLEEYLIDAKEQIDDDVYAEIIKRDSLIEIYMYIHTPVSHYKIYHYDIESAVDICLEILDKEKK